MSYTAVEKLTRLLYVSEFECVCVYVYVCQPVNYDDEILIRVESGVIEKRSGQATQLSQKATSTY